MIVPRGNFYHVRFTKAADRTPGGILLPDSLQTNWQEAEVIAAGPGKEWPIQDHDSIFHHTMWCEPGDVVFFTPQVFRAFGEGSKEGCVADEHLIGVVHPTGLVEPLNDWVLLDLADFEETAGPLILPDEQRHRPSKGTIRDFGPGQLRTRGPLMGTLKPVHAVMNLPEKSLEGTVVHWEAGAEVFEFGREWTEGVLVQAKHLIAAE